ncbi:MAG: Ig-like domain repeat protein [Methanobrevibacter sp.]|uniref:hypothetical protein n=1 Tax=Methanobrevibacter sp. TaxID=66852 RepID=UPI0025CE4A35|nr:hypothetical protein [Methanobrevibacter sp.]MBE6497033.1 Ig-like domain repeat protein [Methanobrevibacter sp.]
MNMKINTTCFILLLLLLITAVSAADNENETLEMISQPDSSKDLCSVSVESNDELQKTDDEKLSETVIYSTLIKEGTKKKVTLSAPNVKMYYKDGSKFTATLKYQKMLIENAKIKIQIDGKTYTKTTNNKGQVSLNLNLKSGTYTVLSSCSGNSEFEGATAKSTVTIKSTIKANDFSKYYKNSASYSSTFYDKKGKLLKNTAVKYKLNGKTYSVKTSTKGIAKLAIDLKPRSYPISIINSKTTETITKTVTINSLIVSNDLTFSENKKGKFNVKILNSNGKVSAKQKVTIKIDGKTYTKTTNSKGIATLELSLIGGEYTITTQYSGLKSTNNITVNKIIKSSSFIHTLLIPTYANITTEHVFDYPGYTLKSGLNGIIKMPKNELFAIQIGNKSHMFSNIPFDGITSTLIGYKYHLIPLDGSKIISDTDKSKLKGEGIIISRSGGFTQIDYQSKTSDNVELFGIYADKGLMNSETFTYMQNDKITAKVNVLTQSFDEFGLRYSLSKFYQKTIYDFNYKSYDEITNHNTDCIRFVNTNTPVTFSYFGKSIAGYVSKEKIITKFIVNGKEELEQKETISYGLGEKYRKTVGFEVLQAYSIITEKITSKTLENWVKNNKIYLNRFGVMNAYGMHLASLETFWLADKLADEYSSDFGVTWKRTKAATILGGINLEDTYLNILNADMGMEVKGNADNINSFRLINSLQLPNIEEYCLDSVSLRYLDFTTNSQDNMYIAINNNKSSIAQLGEMLYIFSEDGSNSAIIVNTTSGVASVIHEHNNATYKGSSISTVCDCCSIVQLANDIMGGVNNALNIFSNAKTKIKDFMDQIHPMSKIAYKMLTQAGGKILTGVTKATLGIIGNMVFIQQLGVDYRETKDQKDWYKFMDTITFTRPGYLQNKKVYNIPNSKGGYDYLEVKLNSDLSLDRDNAIYISDGKSKKLSRAETYSYFSDEYWSPINVPTKYWDKSWTGMK